MCDGLQFAGQRVFWMLSQESALQLSLETNKHSIVLKGD
jgi:hypothetical protein